MHSRNFHINVVWVFWCEVIKKVRHRIGSNLAQVSYNVSVQRVRLLRQESSFYFSFFSLSICFSMTCLIFLFLLLYTLNPYLRFFPLRRRQPRRRQWRWLETLLMVGASGLLYFEIPDSCSVYPVGSSSVSPNTTPHRLPSSPLFNFFLRFFCLTVFFSQLLDHIRPRVLFPRCIGSFLITVDLPRHPLLSSHTVSTNACLRCSFYSFKIATGGV